MTDLLFTPEEHEKAAELVSRFAKHYEEGLRKRPVFPNVDRAALRKLMEAPMPQDGQAMESLFRELEEVILPNSTHTAHPRFLPYVQPSPNSLSAYAEHVAAVINQNCNLWHLSPAANAVEQAVIRWFADLFNLPDSAGGIMASGGSMANAIALTAARDRSLGDTARTRGLQGRSSPLVLYASDQTHSCVDKAVSALGLGTDHLRHIPSDENFRIKVDLLEQAIEDDRKAGRTPFCVVASAGTVMTGAIDPIEEVARICRAQGLWLHVDGAYGALSVMSERFRPLLGALKHADSVALDPHKFLFCSFEAGCVLVRDRQALRFSYHAHPSYLTMSEDPDFIDFANYGPQLSRGFKALKVWWSLKHYGANAYRTVVNKMAGLAAYMGEKIEQSDALELLAPVTFNCVCFRIKHRSDEDNLKALDALVNSGVAFLGPAKVKGAVGFRACFMNLRTTQEDVDLTLNSILDKMP